VLARALAQAAPLLLLDEPTTALDVGRQQQVLELVEELRQEHGLTVMSAMHDLTSAGQYADRLTMLVDGCVVATGTPAEVLTEQRIARVYQARVHIIHEPAGFAVVPRRHSRHAAATAGAS
jgi:iron complex transport system ATP-binding protein